MIKSAEIEERAGAEERDRERQRLEDHCQFMHVSVFSFAKFSHVSSAICRRCGGGEEHAATKKHSR